MPGPIVHEIEAPRRKVPLAADGFDFMTVSRNAWRFSASCAPENDT
jgi:hypothetical protein